MKIGAQSHCVNTPVELVQVKSTGEIRRQNEGVANTLEGRVHEASVTEVVEPGGTTFYRH